jgi:FkbM family methyltransferase
MIPNIFHFVFGLKEQVEPFHLIFYLCLKSCLEINNPDAIYVYYHHLPHGRYWDLIRDQIKPVWIPLDTPVTNYIYEQKGLTKLRYAHESDFIRLEKLIEHGGIYADMDTIFVNPIPAVLYEKSFVLGREDNVLGKPSLCNAFIMAEKKARFGQLWLDGMKNSFNGTWSEHSTLFPARLAETHPELIHLEPSRTFYKHMWTKEGLRNLFENLDPDMDGVVSLHLWAHIWWKRRWPKKVNMHANHLTETYIRKVDTTYNLLARPYLPNPSYNSLRVTKKWSLTSCKKRIKRKLKKSDFLYKIWRKFPFRPRDKADKFLEDFFASTKPKTIVQVGANDGIMCDPLSRFFQKSGNYQALLIEPIPYYFKKLSKLYENRTDIFRLNIAIGAEETKRRLYFISPEVAEKMNGNLWSDDWAHGQGSFDYEMIVYWIKQNAFRGQEYQKNIPFFISAITYIDVWVKPLKKVMPLSDNVLLVIDVQGAEYEVLSSLDWGHPPEYIMIEDDLDKTAHAIRLLYYHGYEFVCGTYNKIYKRSDRYS